MQPLRLLLMAAMFCVACSENPVQPILPDPDPDPDPDPNGDGTFAVALQTVVEGLSAPLAVTAPTGDPRLFVVEQAGRIRVVRDGQLLPTPFLDIREKVEPTGERGLLGLAFHPEYEENGFFYVNYTHPDQTTRIERYQVSTDPDIADPASVTPLLTQVQPFHNHNGGHLEFGPDGLLYIGLGDGGGDGGGNSQNPATLLGAILRIDVDGGTPYAIPDDNPFRNTAGARGEIWAIGLRNPWRFSFDPPAERLYIADVGQNIYEEVNAVSATAAGLNYGWDIMEGQSCYRTTGCDMTGLIQPVVQYTHDDGCSITGGLVYRGAAIPQLVGHYVYSDYCGGWIRSFLMTDEGPTLEREWEVPVVPLVTSFGRGSDGEIYVVSGGSGGAGALLRIVPRD